MSSKIVGLRVFQQHSGKMSSFISGHQSFTEVSSDTRWSSSVAANHPIVKHMTGILKSLDCVLTEMNLTLSDYKL